MLLSLLISFVCHNAWSETQKPYWQSKPELYSKVLNERKILVSVKDDKKTPKTHLQVTGVGVVSAPLSFAKKQLLNFEELPEISSYFKKVTHKRDKREVYFHVEAIGLQVRFLQRYRWLKQSSDESILGWEVIWGPLRGMAGNYTLKKVGVSKTEVSVWANAGKIKAPIPDFLLNFTLEVIAEKVAQKMRTLMEKRYKDSMAGEQIHGKQ